MNNSLKDPVVVTIMFLLGLMAFGVIGTLVVRPQHVPPQIRAAEDQIARFMEGLAL
jgi:hypothetical protein